MVLRTHRGRYAYGHVNEATWGSGSVSGLPASQINDTTTVEGFGQNMALKRRIDGRVYLLQKYCGRYAYGHVNEATWGSG
ncbi:hypothetical protein GN958_ATG10134 [Phytophthora infestans]|uniref:Uncharacterized protein n=1 Tax=Phytophthora infestans TaxID=4787 RepID=A0A8S9UIR2_PHYIN|nr:hypothetical protein GN958_ATG10134 [Phytophthora infestans]